MSISDKSLSMIIYSLRMIIILIMGFMISPTEAAVSCTSTSYQCCWVRRIWELMGKTTSVSSTSATACCYYLGSKTQTSGIPGVNCTSTGLVTQLQWGAKSLSGSIPPEIGNLKNLEWLVLYNNKLNGTIPTTIGNLVKLIKLSLYYNQLSGNIPSEIGNLTNLEILSLWGNKLNGSIPSTIENLTKLKEIVLNDNQLSGIIPSTIGKLVNLIWLNFRNNSWNGPIPSTIGNLTNLQVLDLRKNQLTGPIPSEIGNIVNLWELYVNGNVDMSGPFTPNCGTKVYASETSLTICGCATKGSPAFLFPPPGTPDVCLATGPSSPLQKRVEIFSQNIGSYRYTCNVDVNLNPNQDCLNTQAKICNTTYMGTDATRLSDCKNGVDKMALNMSTYWQAVRRECGQWPGIDGFTGNKDSDKCKVANNDLIANAYYLANGVRIYVTSALTSSVNAGLWGNTQLKG